MKEDYTLYTNLTNKVDNINTECVKKSDLKEELVHYATKYYLTIRGVLVIIPTLSVLILSYLYLTPIMIKNENLPLMIKIETLSEKAKDKELSADKDNLVNK